MQQGLHESKIPLRDERLRLTTCCVVGAKATLMQASGNKRNTQQVQSDAQGADDT